ncbi:MAG: sodium:solute symporter, partial [Bacteroidaceae bacterium]|nr:sodium:solute symporter [Bacteroidaceae bacterium]
MTGLIMLVTLLTYFSLLLWISYRMRKSDSNDAFFRAGRHSSWGMVAFGMIGASISGVSFVSVPGWVNKTDMTYLQMCAGFFFGYLLVAFVLLPMYYRLKLTSIYSYLRTRFGATAQTTGASFFIMSRLAGSAARLYLACVVLQEFVSEPLGMPFPLTVVVVLVLIWLYTRRSGIKTIVHTDVLQTLCLLLALVTMFVIVVVKMDLSPQGVIDVVANSDMSNVFCWDTDSRQYFWRQFLSGVFVVVVMTGLDQDMMQKNLTCLSLRAAQKDMCAYGICFLPVNFLFLVLGILLYTFANQHAVTATGDELMPALVKSGLLGNVVIIPFAIGIVSAAFSSADSTMTSLTTSICIDIVGVERKGYNGNRAERVRKRIHIAVVLAFLVFILIFRIIGSRNVIDTIYVMASYTYGPLLGLYAFGMFTKRNANNKSIPYICVAAPIICGALDYAAP